MRNANAIPPGCRSTSLSEDHAAAAIALLQRLVAELSGQRIAGCRFAVPGKCVEPCADAEPCADGQPSFFWPSVGEMLQEAEVLLRGDSPPRRSAPAQVRLVLVAQPHATAADTAAGGKGGRP